MTDTAYLTHKIQQDERWDLLAYRYYGDIGEINRLLDANPHLSFCERLPVGEWLLVPVIDVKVSSQANLPPWMQVNNQDVL